MAMTNSYARRRRRGPKAGSTAIPFMITILISLLVFGSVALYFYTKLTAKSRELKPMQASAERITEADINTIVFVLKPDDEARKKAVMLMRFNPIRKQIICIGIPLELQVQLDDRLMTVGACLENHGPTQLKTALATTLDQTVDRYIELNDTGFKTLVNIFGNPKTTIDIDDNGLKNSKGLQVTLDIEKYEQLLTSNKYVNEEERSTKIGISVAQLLNDCISPEDKLDSAESDGGARIAENLDTYFNDVFNAVTTDITVMDFDAHKHAISFVFQKAVSPARGMGIVCDAQDDGTLTINESFKNTLEVLLEPDEILISDGQSETSAPAEGSEDAPAEQPAEQPAEEQPADDAADGEQAE